MDSSGLVVGATPGKSIVQASAAGGLMATLPVEVEQADIALLGAVDALGPQDAETLSVRVPSQSNREVRTGIQWESTDTAVATVDRRGGHRAGARSGGDRHARIRARAPGAIAGTQAAPAAGRVPEADARGDSGSR